MEEFNLEDKIEKSKDAYMRQHALEDYLGKLLKAMWSERNFVVNRTEIGRALQEEGNIYLPLLKKSRDKNSLLSKNRTVIAI